jgi:hypothetical protein
MVRVPHSLLRSAFLAGLACLGGCGGSGGGNSDGLAEKFTLSRGALSAVGIVDDYGDFLGQEAFSANGAEDDGAYWTDPYHPAVLPNLDSKTKIEYASVISPSRKWIGGISLDTYLGSGIPQRAFVYNVETRLFHVLQLGSSSELQFSLFSIDDSGNTTGYINNPGEGTNANFSYSLAADTYTASVPPDFSSQLLAVNGLQVSNVWGYSANYAYAVGTCQGVNTIDSRAVVWNVATGEGQVIDLPGQNDEGWNVSNDGKEAIYYNNTDQQTYVWTASTGPRSVLNLFQAAGFGSGWSRSNWVSLSPGGNYLACTGMIGASGTVSYPVLARLK